LRCEDVIGGVVISLTAGAVAGMQFFEHVWAGEHVASGRGGDIMESACER
jgi:hypothetical protein